MKTPPRFVPTLTDVVPEPEHAAPVPPNPVQAVQALQAASEAVASPPEPAAPAALPPGFEELVVHRVMQRVDVVLDQRLREAIARVVQEQTRSLVPRLREEVESVVRDAVYQAVADELAAESHRVP